MSTTDTKPVSAEALASEHAKAREAVMEFDHPIEGKVPNVGYAVKLLAQHGDRGGRS